MVLIDGVSPEGHDSLIVSHVLLYYDLAIFHKEV